MAEQFGKLGKFEAHGVEKKPKDSALRCVQGQALGSDSATTATCAASTLIRLITEAEDLIRTRIK